MGGLLQKWVDRSHISFSLRKTKSVTNFFFRIVTKSIVWSTCIPNMKKSLMREVLENFIHVNIEVHDWIWCPRTHSPWPCSLGWCCCCKQRGTWRSCPHRSPTSVKYKKILSSKKWPNYISSFWFNGML